MGNKFLILLCSFVVVAGVSLVPLSESIVAFALVGLLGGLLVATIGRYSADNIFIAQIFLLGLALRLSFGIMVHVFELREFFGGDANTYDTAAVYLIDVWAGVSAYSDNFRTLLSPSSGVGYGMVYFVAAIYSIIGRNIFAAQCVCAVIGAATAPMIYFCANEIYQNKKVSRFSALAIAIFPSFVIWSGQLLKDGPIMFLLVLTMTMVVQIQKKIDYGKIIIVILCLLGIFTLRFYVFYPLLIAIIGSFFVSSAQSSRALIQRSVIVIAVGFAMSFLGINRSATEKLEYFGSLERLQTSRLDLSHAESGYGEDADISTTAGALATLPLGLAYLMLAPFPWQATNIRQAITIPEVLIWWTMLPLAVWGSIYTIKRRFRNALAIVIFTFLLTVAYSVSQGNVGTAYRQRTQIQVFLFLFIAVGWILYKERQENKRLIRTASQEGVYDQLRKRQAAS